MRSNALQRLAELGLVKLAIVGLEYDQQILNNNDDDDG